MDNVFPEDREADSSGNCVSCGEGLLIADDGVGDGE
jgi:hypothetical protein